MWEIIEYVRIYLEVEETDPEYADIIQELLEENPELLS